MIRKMHKGTDRIFALTLVFILAFSLVPLAQPTDSPYEAEVSDASQLENLWGDDEIRLILRLDDVGFCHAANQAFKKIAEEGLATAVSVIVNTPWLDEAVELLKQHPEISVGLHSCLNSEWTPYRWGPVLPVPEARSLVDEWGKFFGTVKALIDNEPKLDEVEREIRAQVDLALRKGLKLSYIDHHMSAAVRIPGMQPRFVRIARDYELGISRWFGERADISIYSVTPELKADSLIEQIRSIDEPGTYLIVFHPGLNTSEMAVLQDLNPGGLENMSVHREAETLALCDPRLKDVIAEKKIQLVGYDLLREKFLDRMKAPE